MKKLIIILLLISSVIGQSKYNRKDFKHWVDVDKDCQDARQEVLIEESIFRVTYKEENKCKFSYFSHFTFFIIPNKFKCDTCYLVYQI